MTDIMIWPCITPLLTTINCSGVTGIMLDTKLAKPAIGNITTPKVSMFRKRQLSNIWIEISQVIKEKAVKNPRSRPSLCPIDWCSVAACKVNPISAGVNESQRCWVVLFDWCFSWLKIKNADKQYKTMLRALAMVGNIIIFLWSRTRIVTEFFKCRTTLRYTQIYVLVYLEIHNLACA